MFLSYNKMANINNHGGAYEKKSFDHRYHDGGGRK